MIISSDWGAREELAFSGEILSKTLLVTYVMVTPLMVNVLVTYMCTIVFKWCRASWLLLIQSSQLFQPEIVNINDCMWWRERGRKEG